MTPLVIDASAAIAYLTGEAAGVRVERALEPRRKALVPWIFWSEVINVLARRHRWPGSQVLAAVHDLEQMGLQTEQPSRVSMLAVIDTVDARGLTAYDAEYLVLAESSGGDLLTGDARLAQAAGPRAILIGMDPRIGERSGTYEPHPPDQDPDWPRWSGATDYLAELRREVQRDLVARSAPTD